MEIRELDQAAWIYDLQPVSFQRRLTEKVDDGETVYLDQGTGKTEYGLIAEEVELVEPYLVYHDENGTPAGVGYKNLITPMLVEIQRHENEIQRLNKRIEELGRG